MYMTYLVTITSQGQISIPAPLRRQFKLNQTKKARVEAVNDTIVIHPEPDIMDFEGIFKTTKKIPFKKIRRAFEEALARGEA